MRKIGNAFALKLVLFFLLRKSGEQIKAKSDAHNVDKWH